MLKKTQKVKSRTKEARHGKLESDSASKTRVEMRYKLLQVIFDSLPIFASQKTGVTSNAPELAR